MNKVYKFVLWKNNLPTRSHLTKTWKNPVSIRGTSPLLPSPKTCSVEPTVAIRPPFLRLAINKTNSPWSVHLIIHPSKGINLQWNHPRKTKRKAVSSSKLDGRIPPILKKWSREGFSQIWSNLLREILELKSTTSVKNESARKRFFPCLNRLYILLHPQMSAKKYTVFMAIFPACMQCTTLLDKNCSSLTLMNWNNARDQQRGLASLTSRLDWDPNVAGFMKWIFLSTKMENQF